MAAPHVSGLAGLVWASSNGTSAQAVFDQLTRTADRVPFTGQFRQYGRVNAAAALGAPPSTPTPTLPPSNIRGWGSNQWGRLTDPVDQYVRLTPAPMLGPGEVSAVAAGSSMTLALATDGTVWASGSGLKGDLGRPGTDCTPYSADYTPCTTVPLQVPGLSGVKAIAAGRGALALRDDGMVWAWGDAFLSTQPADCPLPYRPPCSPTPVRVSGLSQVSAIAAGGVSMAVKADGTLWTWGLNSAGQLGDGTLIGRPTPVQAIGLSGVVVAASGLNQSLAVTSDGSVWAWSGGPGGWAPNEICGPNPSWTCRTNPIRGAGGASGQ
jgi:hypothetical protein